MCFQIFTLRRAKGGKWSIEEEEEEEEEGGVGKEIEEREEEEEHSYQYLPHIIYQHLHTNNKHSLINLHFKKKRSRG